MGAYDIIWVLFGDFNVVRSREERLGSIFSERDARFFYEFISSGDLQDFAIGGRRFTRYNREGTNLSKLDRFLVSCNFFNAWKDAKVKTLDRLNSDHCPIMISSSLRNFGPKCFKLFNHWMNEEGFSNVVEASWENLLGRLISS